MYAIFQMPIVDANNTVPAAPVLPPMVHGHTGGLSHKHGLRHHKLTTLYSPVLTSLLSAESAESAEVVPVVHVVVDAAAPATPAADPVPADPAPVDPAPDAAADPAPAADFASASDATMSKEVPRILFKRDVAAASAPADTPAAQTDPLLLVPVCPGRVRFFK